MQICISKDWANVDIELSDEIIKSASSKEVAEALTYLIQDIHDKLSNIVATKAITECLDKAITEYLGITTEDFERAMRGEE